jgi:hypothetical protein
MRAQNTIRQQIIRQRIICWTNGAIAALCIGASCAMAHGQQAQVLDRVVAVVNNQAILESDVQNELHLYSLDPERGSQRTLSARRALQLLISRRLIQQQIGQGTIPIPPPTDEAVKERLQGLREQLPACVAANCKTDAGWAHFLEENGLSEAEVEQYLRLRMELLAFIETRFRQGIQIAQDEIAKYYNETLLPQYPKGEKAPSLETVAPRIEEILLQQKVNALFSTWLSDLRKQGDIEVLDKSLETADANGQAVQ